MLPSVGLLLAISASAGCNPSPIKTQPVAEPPAPKENRDSAGEERPAAPALEEPVLKSTSPIDALEEGRLYRQALRALDEGDPDTTAAIQASLTKHPTYGVLGEALAGFLLAHRGQHEQALRVAEQISTVPIMQPEAYMLAGAAFRSQGRWGQAIACFQNAVELNPGHDRAHRWLGAMYHDTGAMHHAVRHLRTAAGIDVTDYRPLRLAGLIHYEYENYTEAARDYQRALRRRPPEHVELEIRLELADSLRELRRFDEALQTLAPCPQIPAVLAAQAECYEAKGEIALAKRAAGQALQLEPRHRRANLILGRISLGERDFAAAVKHLQIAVELEPTDHEPRFLLGRALIQAGRREEGEAEIAESTRLKETFLQLAELHLEALERPDDVAVRVRLGELAEQLGRPRVALMWYRAALGLQPDHAAAAAAVERLGNG